MGVCVWERERNGKKGCASWYFEWLLAEKRLSQPKAESFVLLIKKFYSLFSDQFPFRWKFEAVSSKSWINFEAFELEKQKLNLIVEEGGKEGVLASSQSWWWCKCLYSLFWSFIHFFSFRLGLERDGRTLRLAQARARIGLNFQGLEPPKASSFWAQAPPKLLKNLYWAWWAM